MAKDNKVFCYDFVTYLKDSNAYGTNYFARYFEWQGVCREAFVFSCVAEDFLAPVGMWITKTAHNEFIKETKPFSQIRCKLTVKDLKKASLYLLFEFCDQKDESIIYSKGYQKILFVDHEKKIRRIPEIAFQRIKQYEPE